MILLQSPIIRYRLFLVEGGCETGNAQRLAMTAPTSRRLGHGNHPKNSYGKLLAVPC